MSKTSKTSEIIVTEKFQYNTPGKIDFIGGHLPSNMVFQYVFKADHILLILDGEEIVLPEYHFLTIQIDKSGKRTYNVSEK